jgi:hypothetical protein
MLGVLVLGGGTWYQIRDLDEGKEIQAPSHKHWLFAEATAPREINGVAAEVEYEDSDGTRRRVHAIAGQLERVVHFLAPG